MKVLSEIEIEQFNRDGYCFPTQILSAEQVAACRTQLEAFETSQSQPIGGAHRNKSHLLFKWVDDLMRHA